MYVKVDKDIVCKRSQKADDKERSVKAKFKAEQLLSIENTAKIANEQIKTGLEKIKALKAEKKEGMEYWNYTERMRAFDLEDEVKANKRDEEEALEAAAVEKLVVDQVLMAESTQIPAFNELVCQQLGKRSHNSSSKEYACM